MQSGKEKEPGLVEEKEEEDVPTTSDESRNILEQSNVLSEVESERTKDQLHSFEAESTLGESTNCDEIESEPWLLEGHAQVENVGCEPEENFAFPNLKEPHQRLWRDIRNFDTLGSTESEGDDEGDNDLTKEIEQKKDETDIAKVSPPTSRKWLVIKLVLAGSEVLHISELYKIFVDMKKSSFSVVTCS